MHRTIFSRTMVFVLVVLLLGSRWLGSVTTARADDPPTLYVFDAWIVEGDSGITDLTLYVHLPATSPTDVGVDFSTAAVSATAGVDYMETFGTLVIPANQPSAFITIPILGDTLEEAGDESFTLTLSNPVGTTLLPPYDVTTITILDDDASIVPALSISDVSISEGNAGAQTLQFTVNLSEPSTSSIGFDFSTEDDTALAGEDYDQTTGSLIVAPNQNDVTFEVNILGDTTLEADETFRVTLSNPRNATIVDGTAVGTLRDDDGTPPLITIKLDAQPDSSANIVFTGTLGTFRLDDPTIPDNDAYANAKDFTKPAGSYQVNQRVSNGWLLSAINCDAPGKATVDLANKRVTLTVVNGDHVTCTFVHQRLVAITARVFHDRNRVGTRFGVRNANDPFLADWAITVYTSTTGASVTQVTVGGVVSKTLFSRLLPDVEHVVCVTLQPGWVNSKPDLNPSYGKPCTTITLAPGKGATLNFGVYQPVSASAFDESDEMTAVSDTDQIYDLPLDETASEEGSNAETTNASRIFLPIMLR